MKKDFKIYKGKKERIKSITLKAKKESSDDETSTSESNDEEYAIVVRNFKKFFRRKGKFVRQPREERSHSDKGMRRKERVTGNVLDAVFQIISLAIVQNHLATNIKMPSLEVLGVIEKMTDNASSLDNDSMKIDFNNLYEISLKIIIKNKILKTKRDLLEKEILELNEKIKKLERSKEIEIACKSCEELKLENAKLKKTQVKFVKFDKNANSLREMLNNQKLPSCKVGLGFDSHKASTSGTKTMSFIGSSAEKAMDGSTIKVHRSTLPGFPHPTKLSPLVDDDVGEEEAIKRNTKLVNNNNEEDESIKVDEIINIKESKNNSLNQVIGNLNQRTLRSQAQNHSNFFCFISTRKPKDVKEALKDESWVVSMQEELNQFIANDVWELVPLPISQSVIGTKWFFRNKLDENGIVSKNKDRLVAQEYNQQEGIDYDEIYALVARLESIRILLAIACASDFKLYQMDVKSAFLNGFLNEEQAPKAWYDILKAFLIKHEYSIGMVDNTLFTKNSKSHLIIVQIYVDDIIFGSTSQNLCDDFAKIMHDEFEMSVIGELNFFLGLQIKQMEDKIFFNQSKYIKEMLKKFGLEDSKPTKTPMSTEINLTKDDEANSVDSSKYRGMIGSLLYLTASRPDIMFSVYLCARF
nr:retrovirus-related Pol polyprotein from transposon TNT 1-94 [Tanacetum cinerariifolium]